MNMNEFNNKMWFVVCLYAIILIGLSTCGKSGENEHIFNFHPPYIFYIITFLSP